MIQAKFRQRPHARDDAQWLLTELSGELKKFRERGRRLRRPEYYILATNVVLTPTHESGGKDRVMKCLADACADLGIRDTDVWDYDKLCRLLDNNADVRTRYSTFITPGDVLAEALRGTSAPPDFHETITAFLQRELRADQYVKLEQAGYANEEQTRLAQVFVDVPAHPRPESFDDVDDAEEDDDFEDADREDIEPGVVDTLLQGAAQKLDRASVTERAAALGRGPECPEPGRYVLVGGPGQGKTTLGQYVCQLHRAAILRDVPQRQMSAESTQALSEFLSQTERDGFMLPTVRRFPVRIVLSQFADALASRSATSLLSYLALRLRNAARTAVTEEHLRVWLTRYPWLLVLDGLDEVPPSSNRQDVIDRITDFWSDAAVLQADVFVLATTRPQGYGHEFVPSLYRHLYLAPLSQATALRYACRLVQVRHAADEDRQQKILTRLEVASAEPATARLMRSPLQVTIMALLVDRFGEPPRQRWNLFQKYYDVMYERELERQLPSSRVLRDHRTHIDTIHRRVALRLQLEGERAGGAEAVMDRKSFSALVLGRLNEVGFSGPPADVIAKQIIDAAMQRLVFLVAPTEGHVGFEIRSLQEFMAAAALTTGSDQQLRDRLAHIALASHWRNVLLFAAGRIVVDREYLVDDLLATCVRLNESSSSDRAVLSGSRLALDVLDEGLSSEHPTHAAAFARLSLRVLDTPEDGDIERLTGCYEVSLRPVFEQELSMRILQRALDIQRPAWGLVVALAELGHDWALELFRNRISGGATLWGALDDCPLTMRDARLLTAMWELSLRYDAPPTDWPIFFKRMAFDAATAVPPVFVSAVRAQGNPVRPEDSVRFAAGALGRGRVRFRSLQDTASRVGSVDIGTLPETQNWRCVATAVLFASSPDSRKLGSLLRATAKCTSQRTLRALRDRVVPWPAAACLSDTEPRQLIALAEAAERGDLGDTHEWVRAEARWRTHGVTLQELENFATSGGLPYSRDIYDTGFPFTASKLDWGPRNPSVEFVGRLIALRNTAPGGPRRVLTEWLASCFFSRATAISGTVDEWVGILSECETTGALKQLPWPAAQDEEWVPVLEVLGTRKLVRRLVGTKSGSEVIDRVLSQFWSKPNSDGLLQLAVRVGVPSSDAQLDTALFDPSRFESPTNKLACMCLQMIYGRIRLDEAERFAEQACSLLERAPYMAGPFADVLSRGSPFSRGMFEAIAASVVNSWPVDAAPVFWRNRVADTLLKAVRQRTSQLENPDVWRRLGLPSVV
ncbi:NACHT domain-containing NTPase [Anaeromyxobacter sp. SG17]|uniref:NACHT domain-containing protein n=1 Tax=Anaeromyxobacter sp. SG17 TaxID=2925405 RepID=UPI001F5A554F|nr:hypothetical protein [Anaeromyxobacter sp. SG17]